MEGGNKNKKMLELKPGASASVPWVLTTIQKGSGKDWIDVYGPEQVVLRYRFAKL